VSAIAGLSFALLLFVLRFVYGPGWAAEGVFTIFAVLFIFLGVQLLGMGLLGEYIGRISRDVQRRPRYLVHEVIGSGYGAGAAGSIGRAASREIGA
jgi:undecaprenyl-phosphate 4-deoxy-4-formamido-L-arabinose transferase